MEAEMGSGNLCEHQETGELVAIKSFKWMSGERITIALAFGRLGIS